MFRYSKKLLSALLCTALFTASVVPTNAAELTQASFANTFDTISENTMADSLSPDEAVSENTLDSSSISGNSVSDNSVSDNTVSTNHVVSENDINFAIEEDTVQSPQGDGVLCAPTILQALNSKKGVVKLKYSAISGALRYEISYSRNASFPSGNTVTYETNATAFSISNLPQKAKYYFRVRAIASSDTGLLYSPYSANKKITIKNGVKEISYKDFKKASVTSCKIVSKTQFVFQVKLKKRIASKTDLYYLVKLNPVSGNVESVVAKSGKKTSNKFTIPLIDANGNSLLFGQYALAIKNKNGKYILITKTAYITNPTAAATYTATFPKSASKKGLQGALTKGDLGVNHSLINLRVSDVIAEGTNGVPYVYNGKTYYFKKNPMTTAIRYCNTSGITLSMVFLLDYRDDIAYLIPKKARQKGTAPYYAWDVTSKQSRETIEAMFSYLGELYSKEECHVDNWILGNELNSGYAWHYYGKMSYKEYVKTYAHAFRIMSYAVKSHYKNARCYISLDNNWQANGQSLSVKQFMLDFDKELKAQSNKIGWNLAYHAYPAPLTAADFWNNTLPTNDANTTRYVTPKNLSILTSFVKKNFGKNCRIILSEQGFTSTNGETTQAAAVAYAYYIAEFNDMIDSFIMRSKYDNLEESNAGLKMGLMDLNSRRKLAYDVYKYMDTPQYKTYTADCLKTLGKSNWKQLVKGFSGSRFH